MATTDRAVPATLMAYVALAPCGCWKQSTVDLPHRREATAQAVAEAIREGWAVEWVTLERAREMAKETCGEH